MNFKRIFTAIIALVLVVCLMVDVSPIKAEAATVTGGITGWQAFLFLISASAGALFNAEIPTEPPAIIEYAEQSLDNFVVENYEFYFPDSDPDDDDDTDLQEFWDDLKESVNKCFDETGSFQTLDEFLSIENQADWVYAKKKLALSNPAIGIGSILDKLLAEWYVDLYDKGFFELFGDSADEGYQYYNDILLPDFSKNVDINYSNYNYRVILYNSNDKQYTLYVAPSIGTVSYSSGDGYNFFKPGSSISYYAYSSSAQWNGGFSVDASISYGITDPVSIVWSSHDLYFDNGSLFFPGSEPSDTQTITIEPDFFFGPYVEQNEAGTLTSDSFNLPEYDFSNYIYSKDSIQDQIKQTYDQISNGQMSYDDYMESITYEDSNNDNVGGDSTDSPSDPGGVGSDNDYLSSKVNALLNEFSFARSIVETAKAVKTCLAGVATEPPVIYIHLEDNRGSYDIGGTVPFLDLRWYAEYKPTVDALISAFLWICFAWKMLLKLPGIISGVPGDFVMDSVHHIGMSEHMPVRKAEYEVQRISNREYIRRGKDG